ncbi:MAG: hypothetical protein H7301_06215 [Cryobacterium sp.]|nr:hypothetical protein [Oligoflexia bacterium]
MRFFVFFLISLYSVSTFAEGSYCPLLLGPAPDQASLDAKEFVKAQNVDYSKGIFLEDIPVSDQGDYGCCWVSSLHGYYNRITEKVYGYRIGMNDDYTVLMSLLLRIDEGIYNGEEILQGGWVEGADWIDRNFGMMPAISWRSRLDLQAKGVGDELVAYLNKEIGKFQKYLLELKGRETPGNKMKVERDAWRMAQDLHTRLTKELHEMIGTPPSSFTISGKPFTPKSFMKTLVKDHHSFQTKKIKRAEPRARSYSPKAGNTALVEKQNSLLELFPDTKDFFGSDNSAYLQGRSSIPAARGYSLWSLSHPKRNTSETRSVLEMETMIHQKLKSGSPVFITVQMARSYYDNKTGVMSLQKNGNLFVEDVMVLEKPPGLHAILITGEYRDYMGGLRGYRIQNTWGDTVGQRGYYFMDEDYFRAFVIEISTLENQAK